MTNKPTRYGLARRRKVTVRTAFQSMGFDAIQEWVKAYRELDEPIERIRALEKAFEYIYPKLGAMTAEQQTDLELEELKDDSSETIESLPTEQLIEKL